MNVVSYTKTKDIYMASMKVVVFSTLFLFSSVFSEIPQEEGKISLISSEVSYCKYLVYKMETNQLPIDMGLSWLFGILEMVEEQLHEITKEDILFLDCEE